MRVAPGREISVNGRSYFGGDTIPALDEHVIDALLSTGTIEKESEPAKDEEPRGRKK